MLRHNLQLLFSYLLLPLSLVACVTAAPVQKSSAPINRIALVSLSVNNWAGMVSGTAGDAKATALINGMLDGLLTTTEYKLASIKRINRVDNFVGNANYRNMSVVSELKLMSPKVNGAAVANFAQSEEEVITARLAPETAKRLCSQLQVDAVVVVYSEWASAQGSFVPTKRALVKNVVSVWDRSGNQVFFKRVDEMGEGVLGGPYSPIVVNEGTIKQWGSAYLKSLDQILAEMKNTLS